MFHLAQGVLLTRKPDLLSTKKKKIEKRIQERKKEKQIKKEKTESFLFFCASIYCFLPIHKYLASSHCADKVHSLVLAHFSQTIFRVDYDFSDTEAIWNVLNGMAGCNNWCV